MKLQVYEGRIICLYKLLKEDPVARSYLWMYRSGVTSTLCREIKRLTPLISRREASGRCHVRPLLCAKRGLCAHVETQGPKISRSVQVNVHLSLIRLLNWIISGLTQSRLHLREGAVARAVEEVPVQNTGLHRRLFCDAVSAANSNNDPN